MNHPRRATLQASLRSPWFGRFSRQLMRDVLLHVTIAAAAAVTMFLVVDFVEIGNLASDTAKTADLAWLTIFSAPRVFKQLFFVAAPLGALTAIGGAMRRLELPAFLAAGAGPASILKPAACAGLVCALVYAAVVEWLVPPATTEASALRRRAGLPFRDVDDGQRTGWFKGRDRLFRVRALASADGTKLEDVLVLDVAGGQIVDRIDIARLDYSGGEWIGRGIVRRRPGPITERIASGPIELFERPRDFVSRIATPDRLPYVALAEVTETRERTGRPALAHRLELYRRHATALSILFAICLAAALALRLGRRQSVATALGFGATVGFSSWVLEELTDVMGSAGAASPWLAAHALPISLSVLAAWAWLNVARRGIAEK